MSSFLIHRQGPWKSYRRSNHPTDLERLLPHLLPQVRTGEDHPAITAWSELALTTPMLYQVWVYCAAVLQAAMRGSTLDQPDLMISTYAKAISLLNENMKDSDKAGSDETMLSVLGLACHGPIQRIPEGNYIPKQGPLSELQSLAQYGLMDLEPLHIDGLASLVSMRGGLDNIELVGLRTAISQ